MLLENLDKMAKGFGKLGILLDIIGILSEYEADKKKYEEQAMLDNAHQAAVDNQSGMYAIITQKIEQKWIYDPTFWPKGGYYHKPVVTYDFYYYEETAFQSR